MFLAVGLTAAAQDNLVKNGDFENWDGGVPAQWQKSAKGSPSNATVKEAAERPQRKGARSRAQGQRQKALRNSRYHCDALQLKAGNYTLSFYAKAASKGVVSGGWHPTGATGVKGYNYGKELEVDNNEWKQFTLQFTLDQDASIDVFVVNKQKSEGAVFFDDVTLTADGATPRASAQAGTQTGAQRPHLIQARSQTGNSRRCHRLRKALTDNADGWTLHRANCPKV